MPQKYTSFGTATDPLGLGVSQIGGPFRSVILALAGEDWKFAPLKKGDKALSLPERGAYATLMWLEACIPGFRQLVTYTTGAKPLGYGSDTSNDYAGFTKEAAKHAGLPTFNTSKESIKISRDFNNPSTGKKRKVKKQDPWAY